VKIGLKCDDNGDVEQNDVDDFVKDNACGMNCNNDTGDDHDNDKF